jgi:hypothetical protein
VVVTDNVGSIYDLGDLPDLSGVIGIVEVIQELLTDPRAVRLEGYL